jgi:PAS domain S-box-containing protein
MASTAARAYLAFGVLAVGLNAVLGGSSVLYDIIGLTSAVAILAGTLVHRPAAWRPWVGIGLSQALFSFGDVVYLWFDAGFSSVADAFYLGGVVLLVVSLGRLVFLVGGVSGPSSHVDAALLALIAGACGWVLLAPPGVWEGSAIAKLVSLAYPMSDLFLLALLARLIFVRGERTPTYWLMFGAVIPLFISDPSYVTPMISSTYQAGGWLDAGWLLSYVFFGAAALHPSMSRVVVALPDQGNPLPARRAIVLGLGLIAVPTAMIVQYAIDGRSLSLDNEIAMALISAGVVLRGAFLVRDLERLRRKAEQSERRFRMVFERAPIGISIGQDGIMSETNPALQQMLGFTGSEFKGMHYLDITHPDDRTLDQQADLDSRRSDTAAIDKRIVRKDGVVLDAHVRVALDFEDGLGIGLIEDVTGRHELEDQLRQSQKMDSIGKLAGGIAHDFNNLMTAVIGYSDLLLQQADSEDFSRGKVEAIRDSALRASDLTRQLLAFSRRQVMQTQDIDLREVVTKMDTLLKRLIGEDVQLQTLIGGEPVIVRADRTQLEQVVMNLAVNARDAMPGGGTLTVAVVSDGETAVLSVADDGVGMDDGTQARIFEPFFTTKPLAEASGLGLSTVHGIVGQSGGAVEVASAPGAGTTFTIRLPVAEEPVLPVEPRHATLVD